jgi:hypothetical protein
LSDRPLFEVISYPTPLSATSRDCRVDMEVAMGNLIDLVGQQTKSYLDSTRRR